MEPDFMCFLTITDVCNDVSTSKFPLAPSPLYNFLSGQRGHNLVDKSSFGSRSDQVPALHRVPTRTSAVKGHLIFSI